MRLEGPEPDVGEGSSSLETEERGRMYCIKKVLNNNAVVAVDFTARKEVVFLGKGIGFNKKVNQPYTPTKGVKRYQLELANAKGSTDMMLNSVKPIYVEMAGMILDMTQEAFGQDAVDGNILLPLADHIAFTVERMESNMKLANPFEEDIRLLYKEEYEIAQKARDKMEERMGIRVPDNELTFIALYIHSALNDSEVSESMRIPVIIRQSIERIKEECHIDEIGGFAYNRLMYHIKCMLGRVNKNAELDQAMIEFTKQQCPYSYKLAQGICKELGEELDTSFTEAEVSYLALHIERIRINPIEG